MSANEEIVVRAILAGTREYLANAQTVVGSNEEIAASTETIGRAYEHTTRRGYLMNQALFTVRRLLYGVTLTTLASGVAAVKWGFDFNNAMQQARVTLGPLQSNVFSVNRELDYLFNFTKHTPFRFADITTAFRVMYGGMRTLGISSQTVNATIRSTVDALSFAGRTTPGQLNRVAYALQHMAFQGHLTGQVVNQLGRDGIPMAAILRDQFHLTGEEIHNVGRLGIPTLVFLNAYNRWIETHKGYQGAAYRLSIHSFTGLFTTFKDNLSQLMGHIELHFFHRIQSDLVDMNHWFDRIQGAAKGGNIDAVMNAIAGPGAVLMWHRVTDVLHQFWILFSTVVSTLAHSTIFWASVYTILTALSIVLHLINPFLQAFGGALLYFLIPALITWWTVTKVAAFWQGVLTLEEVLATKATRELSFMQFVLAVATGKYSIAAKLSAAVTWLYATAQTALAAATDEAVISFYALLVAMELNPFIWILTAVVLLTAGLVILYFKWDAFHDLVNRTWNWIVDHREIVAAAITVAFAPLGIVLETLIHIKQIWDALGSAWHWLTGTGHSPAPSFSGHAGGSTFSRNLGGDVFAHNLGGFQRMAGGGTVTGSGFSWVGEQGPELLSLPVGASVVPLNQSPFNVREAWMGRGGEREMVHVTVKLNRKVLMEAIAEEQASAGARA